MIKAPLRSLAYLCNRWILGRSELLAEIPRFQLRFRVRAADVNGRHLYKYGVHEPEVTRFLVNTLEVSAGDVILDVGANIGWYSLLVERLARHPVDIIAFEPDPANFALLEENLRLNHARYVTAVPAALSVSAGTAALHRYGESNLGRHSLLAVNEGDSVVVPTVSLDAYWQSRGFGDRVPRLIKMDIEGYELIALRGAARVLAHCPLLIAEYSPQLMRTGGLDPAELVRLLSDAGLRPHEILPEGLRAVDAVALVKSDQQLNLAWTRAPGAA
jgi:FkbM family methyltransferase